VMKINVNPCVDVSYSSYYLKGLYDCFGRNVVQFRAGCFHEFNTGTTFPFVIEKDNININFVIDYGDNHEINANWYNWCDVYGIINFKSDLVDNSFHPKIIRLAPGFGIKIWNLVETIQTSIINFLLSHKHIKNPRKFFGRYWKLYNYSPLRDYLGANPLINYIFQAGTLWQSDEWINNDDHVNRYRFNFFEAANSVFNVRFEGGFVSSSKKNENQDFQKFLLDKWIPNKIYLSKVKNSVVVFNTPAWSLCHGWKLGEYLALGKAIISTPLFYELPSPLIHGTHIHYCSGGIDDIKEAIELIINDEEYRNKLEKGASEYYLRYVKPDVQIKSLLNPLLVQ
jgi:hypothetical protein